HVSAEIPAADPDDHATPPSLPIADLDEHKDARTVDPIPTLDAAPNNLVSPAADSAPVQANPAPQLVGVPSQDAAHPLLGYMVSVHTDHFQFADLKTNEPHSVPRPTDLISHSAAPQLLIEATTPVDHTASANEIPTIPGPDSMVLHSNQSVHA